MANKIGEYMEDHGINFIRECVPTSLEKVNLISVVHILISFDSFYLAV